MRLVPRCVSGTSPCAMGAWMAGWDGCRSGCRPGVGAGRGAWVRGAVVMVMVGADEIGVMANTIVGWMPALQTRTDIVELVVNRGLCGLCGVCCDRLCCRGVPQGGDWSVPCTCGETKGAEKAQNYKFGNSEELAMA